MILADKITEERKKNGWPSVAMWHFLVVPFISYQNLSRHLSAH